MLLVTEANGTVRVKFDLPSGERRDVSLFASVRRTIGRFSNSLSKAGCGRYPTQVSVFALMSTYEAVLHNDAARVSKRIGQELENFLT